ncbi:hypothetical protein MMC21_007501 [Puttea exsequens]|nr:hypothetical protein [Puttea exsequens]
MSSKRSRARPSASASKTAPTPRQNRTSTSTTTTTPHPSLPTYQPPSHPLNDRATRALASLPRDHNLAPLKTRLRVANKQLTDAAGDVGDRWVMETERERRRGGGGDGRDGGNKRREMERLMERLEEGVRRVVDMGAEVERVEWAVGRVGEGDGAERGRRTQSTLGASYEQEDREADGEGEEGEGESASVVLKRVLGEEKARYARLSMAERYASHNDYIGFKKILHDSHHPGPEAPPLPHASTWFPNSSSSSGPSQPQQRAHGHGSSADAIQDDDDVELAETSATINIKCPLTLRPMKEPVTSLKCPHSFEKAAILDMIGRSDVFVGGKGTVGRRAQGGVRGMKCPVCETLLTAADLRDDLVLTRKIKRILAALEARDRGLSDGDDQDEEDVRTKRRRPEEVGSSPARASLLLGLKKERASEVVGDRDGREVSMVPGTQIEGEDGEIEGEGDGEEDDSE